MTHEEMTWDKISRDTFRESRRRGVPPPRRRLVITNCIFVLHYTRKVTRLLLCPLYQRLHTAGVETITQYPGVCIVKGGVHGHVFLVHTGLCKVVYTVMYSWYTRGCAR